jgi:cell fate regulator YaaT (PSP1 superfamily)
MAKYVVRYGSTRMVGVFFTRQDSHRRGARVVARTPRGLELADVLCEATDHAVAQLSDPPGGQILREMLPEDHSEAERLELTRKEDFGICERQIAELALPMQLVDVERLFGGERVVVYYLSEDRVDFRALVKALQGALKTRVEMRQIGVRDEAKLLADYGDCGKPVCCNTHLIDMPPVSMKMAKVQKATLDPTKISGRCGRLKCCLRYEYDTYEELQKTLPPIGSDIITTTGRARVLNHEILSQQLLIQTEDNRRLMIPVADVLTVLHVGSGQIERGRGERVRGESRGESRGERSSERSGDRNGEKPRDDNRSPEAFPTEPAADPITDERGGSPRSQGPRVEGPRAEGPRAEGQARNENRGNGDREERGRPPDGRQPHGRRPDGRRPDGRRPDGRRPDGRRPEGRRPDGSRSNGPRPEGPQPDGPQPDGPQPESQQPSGQQPDSQTDRGRTDRPPSERQP